MKRIEFSENEINELKTFYESELDKLEQRVNNIKLILQRFASGDTTGGRAISEKKSTPAEPAKAEQPRKEAAREVHAFEDGPKKRGRKPGSKNSGKKSKPRKFKWRRFILDTIKKQDRPLSTYELSDIAHDKLKRTEAEWDDTKIKVASNVFRMVNLYNELKPFKDGRGASVYGLIQWFNDKDELKEEYKKKSKFHTEETPEPA